MDLAIQQKTLIELLVDGRTLLKQKYIKQVSIIFQYITKHFPRDYETWLFASEFAFTLKDREQALIFIDKALSLSPNSNEALLLKAQIFISLHEIVDAKAIIQRLCKYQGDNHVFINNLAKVLIELGFINEAIYFYNKAITLKPNFSGYHYNLASTLRMNGDSNAALEALEKTIHLNGSDYEAMQMRSSLMKQTASKNNITHLESVLTSDINNQQGKVFVLYALAKEYEDIGNFEQSFKYLNEGAALRKKQTSYQIDIDINAMTEIRKAFPTSLFNSINLKDDEHSNKAIFILGLPRTGSTLVERILSSHNAVYAAGELDNFSNITLSALNHHARKESLSPKDLFQVTSNIDFTLLGKAYYESVEEWHGTSERFIDKHPMNSQYIGYIHKALPKAKIIHVKRHPIDTCYAIYKNLFANAYPFSYCLDEIASFYIAHHQLMLHWYKTIPEAIYTICYEDLVSDLAGEAKKLIRYCDLEWQEQCLQFHQNNKHSTTASASQVREKVYSTSVNQWKNYEKQLQPLIKRLTAAGIVID